MGNTESNYQPINNQVELTPHEQAIKLKYEKVQEAINNSKWGLFIQYCCKNDLFLVRCGFPLPSHTQLLHFEIKNGMEYRGSIILGYYETISEAEIAVEKRLRDIYGKVENENLAKHPIHTF